MQTSLERPGREVRETMPALPDWLPEEVRHYLGHVAGGQPLRVLARAAGCHASTVLRRVRRMEGRRDDPLVDAALEALHAGLARPPHHAAREPDRMSSSTARKTRMPDSTLMEAEARRILGPLAETGSFLAIAPDMERAVLLRERPGNAQPERLAVLDRAMAQAFVLKDWIACKRVGRVATYTITPAGRAACKRLEALARAERLGAAAAGGFAEAQSPFAEQHGLRDWRSLPRPEGGGMRQMPVNLGETPLAVLARRRDAGGQPFLAPDLVAAGERLREDFEIAQMGPRVTQNWERFLVAGSDAPGPAGERGASDGARAARERLEAALADLGPGLGDIALRCCCYLEGLETAERRMGWSARSGKIVLRIALVRLQRHYEARHGRWGPMIG